MAQIGQSFFIMPRSERRGNGRMWRECTVGLHAEGGGNICVQSIDRSGIAHKYARRLQMPDVREGDHDYANHDTVDDEYPQTIGLEVANEPGDGGVTNDR